MGAAIVLTTVSAAFAAAFTLAAVRHAARDRWVDAGLRLLVVAALILWLAGAATYEPVRQVAGA